MKPETLTLRFLSVAYRVTRSELGHVFWPRGGLFERRFLREGELPEHFARAVSYRERAAGLRRIAVELEDDERRKLLHDVADEYENMALSEEAKSTIKLRP